MRRPGRRVMAVCAVLSMLGISRPARAQQGEPTQAGDVVVIRGLMGYWPGCERLTTQLRAHGYRPWVYRTAVPLILANQIAARRAHGSMSGSLCIVGYSMGADQAIATAKHLEHMGVRVDRLVLFEPTLPGKIPSNVGYCFNLYESRPLTDWLPVFRGIRVAPVNAATPVVNYDVASESETLARENHFTIATQEQAQRLAIGEILRR